MWNGMSFSEREEILNTGMLQEVVLVFTSQCARGSLRKETYSLEG